MTIQEVKEDEEETYLLPQCTLFFLQRIFCHLQRTLIYNIQSAYNSNLVTNVKTIIPKLFLISLEESLGLVHVNAS